MASLTNALQSTMVIIFVGLSIFVGQVLLLQCACDMVGSVSSACNGQGNCDCRSRFLGPKCDKMETGYYIPSVDVMVYQSQDALLSPRQEKVMSYMPISRATERRTISMGLVLRAGFTIFEPTELRFLIELPKTGVYTFVLRYRVSASVNTNTHQVPESTGRIEQTRFFWHTLRLRVLLRTYFKAFACDGINNHTSNQPRVFVSNATAEADYLLFGEHCMLEGSYEAAVQIPKDPEITFEREIVIDSLVVIPSITHYPPYQLASLAQKETMSKYVKDAFSLRTWAVSSEVGSQVLAPIYAYLYEAQACSCDPRGSRYNSCNKYGGQCNCRQNFIGRSCGTCRPDLRYNKTTGESECHTCDCNDHTDLCQFSVNKEEGACVNCTHNTTGEKCQLCKPRYYRNSSVPLNHPFACIECNCSTEGGSQSLVCDGITGQCPCKEHVEGRTCNTCRTGFWKLSESATNGCEEKEVCEPQKAKVKDLQSEVDLIKIIMIVLAVLVGIFILVIICLCFRLRKRNGSSYSVEVKERNTNYGYDTFELSPGSNRNIENLYYGDSCPSPLNTFGSSRN